MEPFIGQILMFGGNFAPRNWALCDGSLLSISQYQALFSILGTTYGGDGRTTFALPDLRGRVPMHPGSGPGLSTRSLGQKGGNESTTLSTANLPSHSHSATGSVSPQAATGGGDDSVPTNGYMALADTDLYAETPDTAMGSSPVEVTVGNTGNGTDFSNVQPFQCVNFIIALTGTYPSRN